MPDAREREAAATELLDAWPWQLGGALIGGYAVAAYGAPRYSDDLDILIPAAALQPVSTWLTENGFLADRVPPDLLQNYTGRIGRWIRDDLTVDILPGAVRDRDALVDRPERWLTHQARRERLVLIDNSTRGPIPVVRRAALWALKLQAGRLRDLGDLLAMGASDADLVDVREQFNRLWCTTLASKLAQVRASLENEKTYRDTLSQRLLGSPHLPRNRDAWNRFRRNVATCIPEERSVPPSR